MAPQPPARTPSYYFVPLLAIASALLGLEGFLIPNGFFDGGVTGICLFLRETLGLPLSLGLPLINLPFLLMGLRQDGWGFALRSLGVIGALAVALALVHVPAVTDDKLLAAVFGGFFLGTGIGLALRKHCVLDGTEILALQVSRHSSFTVGDVVFAFNILIFAAIGLTLGVERALYSILTYIVAGRTADFFLHGLEEYTAVTIVSQQSDRIKAVIQQELQRGVTVYSGRTGMSGQPVEILFCVVTRLEIARLRRLVTGIDEAAFLVMHTIDDTVGGMTARRGLRALARPAGSSAANL